MQKKPNSSLDITALSSDPEVAETSNLESFKSVAENKNFQAAILHRDSENLKIKFAKIFNNEANPIALNHILCAEVKIKKIIWSDFFLKNKFFPEEFKTVRKELESMVRTYNDMTNIKNIRMGINTGLNIKTHDHDYDVLNCTWLKDGTTWKNPENKIVQIPEGDWFFFKKKFDHASPENSADRITTVITPDFNTY